MFAVTVGSNFIPSPFTITKTFSAWLLSIACLWLLVFSIEHKSFIILVSLLNKWQMTIFKHTVF